MKKDYFKPAMRVVEMKQRQIQILYASPLNVQSTSTNLGEDDFVFTNTGSSGNGR